MKYINALNNKNNYYEEAEFKSKAKEIKKEYKTLMKQQHDKEAEKLDDAKQLKETAKNAGKKAKDTLDTAASFLDKLFGND